MSKGFTLVEIVVVVAIFSVVVGLGLFMSMETLRGTIYRSEVATIVSLLQKARSRALNNIEQSVWSTCYDAPNYVVVRGSCGTGTVIDSVAANAGVAAASNFGANFPDVTFAQLSGTTTAASFNIVQDGRTSAISINNEGTIIW